MNAAQIVLLWRPTNFSYFFPSRPFEDISCVYALYFKRFFIYSTNLLSLSFTTPCSTFTMDIEDIAIHLLVTKKRKRKSPKRLKRLVAEWNLYYSATENELFRIRHRVTKNVFTLILESIRSGIGHRRRKYWLEVSLSITLRFLGGSRMVDLSELYGLSNSEGYRRIWTIIQSIAELVLLLTRIWRFLIRRPALRNIFLFQCVQRRHLQRKVHLPLLVSGESTKKRWKRFFIIFRLDSQGQKNFFQRFIKHIVHVDRPFGRYFWNIFCWRHRYEMARATREMRNATREKERFSFNIINVIKSDPGWVDRPECQKFPKIVHILTVELSGLENSSFENLPCVRIQAQRERRERERIQGRISDTTLWLEFTEFLDKTHNVAIMWKHN